MGEAADCFPEFVGVGDRVVEGGHRSLLDRWVLIDEVRVVLRRVDEAPRVADLRLALADLTEPCPNCDTLMRWETSHERCDGCGYIRPCCEGAPCN